MPPAVQPAAPNSSSPAPAYGDEKQWADLEAELADELKEGDEEPRPNEEPVAEAEAAEQQPEEQQARPSYEQLADNYRNMQAALREGRERERESREQLRSITQLIEGLRARREAPPEPQEPRAPSKEEDPIGYFEHRIAQLQKANEELRNGTQETQQAVAQTQQEQVFWAHVDRSEAEAKARLPDYGDAIKFLEQSRWNELQHMYPDDQATAAMARQQGFNSPADLRMAVLNQDRIAVATRAIQLGRSPAQFYYDLAKGRGYTAKTNGQQPPTAERKMAEAKIETARSGQRASRSLSGSGGRTPNQSTISELTALYEDDPEAFDKEWDRMARSGRLG